MISTLNPIAVPARTLRSAGTPASPASEPAPSPQNTHSYDTTNHKEDPQASLAEIKSLAKAALPGAVLGGLALGGAAAAAGFSGGVLGGVVGLMVGKTVAGLGVLAGAAGFGYLGVKHAPQDVRVLFYGLAGVIGGGLLGGLVAGAAGAALGAMAGAHGGLGGAIAGLVAGAPYGALTGGSWLAGHEFQAHPEKYPILRKQLEEEKAHPR